MSDTLNDGFSRLFAQFEEMTAAITPPICALFEDISSEYQKDKESQVYDKFKSHIPIVATRPAKGPCPSMTSESSNLANRTIGTQTFDPYNWVKIIPPVINWAKVEKVKKSKNVLMAAIEPKKPARKRVRTKEYRQKKSGRYAYNLKVRREAGDDITVLKANTRKLKNRTKKLMAESFRLSKDATKMEATRGGGQKKVSDIKERLQSRDLQLKAYRLAGRYNAIQQKLLKKDSNKKLSESELKALSYHIYKK